MKLVIDIPDEEYELDKWLADSGMGSPAINRILDGKPYEERKTGKWHYNRCSECKNLCTNFIEYGNYVLRKRPNYCPSCGLKMEVDE